MEFRARTELPNEFVKDKEIIYFLTDYISKTLQIPLSEIKPKEGNFKKAEELLEFYRKHQKEKDLKEEKVLTEGLMQFAAKVLGVELKDMAHDQTPENVLSRIRETRKITGR